MYAIRKLDLKSFATNSRAVCRIESGSTNAYLRNSRAIEDFLKTIEPSYNRAVQKVSSGTVDHEAVFTVAGFVAYVSTCSPGGMRIQSGPLEGMVEATTPALDSKGVLPRLSDGRTLTDLLQAGTVEVAIDPKYSQAIGISTILRLVSTYGNLRWDFLVSGSADRPFFTSDFPVAIETTHQAHILNRVIPLAPHLAVRIMTGPLPRRRPLDLSFPDFRYRLLRPSIEEIEGLNRLFVQCAEEIVFYRDDEVWVRPFVEKHRHFRIEPQKTFFSVGARTLMIATQRIVPYVQAG